MTQESEHSGFAVEWRSLVDVAAAVGCHDQTLRNWAKAERLVTQVRRGLICTQAFRAYDLAASGRRPPTDLRKPAGYGARLDAMTGGVMSPSTAPLDPEIAAALGGADPYSMDPHELAKRLLGAGVDQGKIRLAVSMANAVQRKKEGDVRAGKNIAPDDVVRMLRSFVELFVEEIDAGAGRFAGDLQRLLRERYGVDLATTRPNLAAELEDFHREQEQKILTALRARLDDQTHGIQALEFTP